MQKFIMLTEDVLKDENLTSNEKIIFALISNYEKNSTEKDKSITIKNTFIAEELNLSVKTITNAIKKLKDNKYIVISMKKMNNKGNITTRREIKVIEKSPKKAAEDVNKDLEKMSDSIKKTEEKTTTKKIDKSAKNEQIAHKNEVKTSKTEYKKPKKEQKPTEKQLLKAKELGLDLSNSTKFEAIKLIGEAIKNTKVYGNYVDPVFESVKNNNNDYDVDELERLLFA